MINLYPEWGCSFGRVNSIYNQILGCNCKGNGVTARKHHCNFGFKSNIFR